MYGHILAHTHNGPYGVLRHEAIVVRSIHSHNVVLEVTSALVQGLQILYIHELHPQATCICFGRYLHRVRA
jgi:hypothetical protein